MRWRTENLRRITSGCYTNHWRNLVETVIRDVPAGIQHVGHEGDGVDTAGRVHHIDDDAGKRRCLKGKTNRLQERTPGGNRGSIHYWGRPPGRRPPPSRSSVSLDWVWTYQGLRDDGSRCRPGEDFNLTRGVDQHIPVGLTQMSSRAINKRCLNTS